MGAGSSSAAESATPITTVVPLASESAGYSAPLPTPLVSAQGVGAANAAQIFVSWEWDFCQIRQAFNAVTIAPGDQAAVVVARNAGLAVILEFDYKTQFMAGQDISLQVAAAAVVDQIKANPGTISGRREADNLQQFYAPAQTQAWQTARKPWPAPFRPYSRSSQFSFPDDVYGGTKADADGIAAAYITAPKTAGADGVDHWAWRQLYQGRISSWLNKDGSSNYIWEALVAGANSLRMAPVPSPAVPSPAVPSPAVPSPWPPASAPVASTAPTAP